MKKVLLMLGVCCILVPAASAQMTIARLKYEEAEEAYTKNEFSTVLTKLDEAQEILGSTNPKILYLRIMAQSGIITQTSSWDFQVLKSARENCSYYLGKYEQIQNNEEKYRDIYKVLEALKEYPADYDTFAAIKEKREKKEADAASVRIVADSLARSYHFQPGMSRTTYHALAGSVVSGMPLTGTVGDQTYYSRKTGLSIAAIFAEGAASYGVDQSGSVLTCSYYIESSKNDYTPSESAFNYYRERFKGLLDTGFVHLLENPEQSSVEKALVIAVPSQHDARTAAYYITIKLGQYNKFSYVTMGFSARRSDAYYGL